MRRYGATVNAVRSGSMGDTSAQVALLSDSGTRLSDSDDGGGGGGGGDSRGARRDRKRRRGSGNHGSNRTTSVRIGDTVQKKLVPRRTYHLTSPQPSTPQVFFGATDAPSTMKTPTTCFCFAPSTYAVTMLCM